MKVPASLSRTKAESSYTELKNERSEWDAEGRQINENLLPGRGIFQTYATPQKRKLANPNIINNVGEEALGVAVSGIHGRLTPPSMPWCRFKWPEGTLDQIEELKAWLQDSESRVHAGLHASNFYGTLPPFYTESLGYGNGVVYVGEDSPDPNVPFRFELLTYGEYAFSFYSDGSTALFYRTIYMSPRQLVDTFKKGVSKEARDKVKKNDAGSDKVEIAVLEVVAKEPYMDKDYVRVFYEITGTNTKKNTAKLGEAPLRVDGFYEHPYAIARLNIIGTDTYGIGLGSKA